MSWLDDLLGKIIQRNGVSVPDRKKLNFIAGIGSDILISDNPATGATDVTLSSTSGAGADPLAPRSNSGTSIYPSATAYAISTGVTFIRGGVADNDSVRFFGAGGSEPDQAAYMLGRAINLTAYFIDLYPLPTQHIFLNGTDLGAGVATALPPGGTANWALDVSLDVHVST